MPPGLGANGIEVNRGKNKIINNGRITVKGAGASGIEANNDNAITNTGRIITSGQEGYGITAQNGNTINNSGTIETSGGPSAEGTADGIQVEDNNTITNSGAIIVKGRGAAGIRAGDGNRLTLGGAITSEQGSALILGINNIVAHSSNNTLRSTSENTPAVVMGSGNRFTNTGRIEATGANAPAVDMGSGNTLTNRGTIEATGTGANAHAIKGGGNNTIDNFGTIKANPEGAGKAMSFTGGGNTVNLKAGSVLIGDITANVDGNKRDTVNQDPGARFTGKIRINVSAAPAYSVLWDAIDSVSARPGSGLPFFYNAQSRQFATYDPRLLATAAQSLGDVSGNISGLMARPVLASSANTRNLSGRAAAFWLSPFGSRARERESGPAGLSPEFTHVGLAGGYDVRLAATQLGVLAGYGRGERVFEGEQRFKPGPGVFKGPFAGLYARQDFARFYVHLGLAGGTLKHEHSRLVNDQRGPNGETRAEARTRSWWLAPEARIGWRALDTGLARFEPSLSARYARQSIRAYTETGIRAPAAVGRRTVEMVETRLEMKASREVGPGRLALRLGWQYRNDLNSNRTQVRLLGETRSLQFASKLGSSVYLGAEAEFELAPGLFFSLNGEAVSGGGYRSLSGMASFYKQF